MATFEPSPDLDPKIAQAIQAAMDALRTEMLAFLEPAGARPSELRAASTDGDRMLRVERAVGAIDRAESQTELLGALLRQAGGFSERAMFLVLDEGHLRGWAAFGFEDAAAEITDVRLAVARGSAWARAVEGSAAVDLDGEACAEACGQIAAAAGGDGVLVPFALRGRVAGALYADRQATGSELDRPALRILTYIAAQALETLPLRRATEPAGETEGTAATQAPPSEVERDVDEMIREVEVTGESEEKPEDEGIVSIHREVTTAELPLPSQDVEEIGGVELDDEPEASGEERRSPWATQVDAGPEPETRETEADVVADEPAEAEAEETPEIEASEPEPEIEEEEEATEPEDEPEPFATQEISTVGSAMEEVEAREPPVMERVVDDAEVAPPADLEGPGWAFGGAETAAADDTRHEEARRLARLLVTEIKLYNEDKVREGRESGNIHEQLHDDIERSRRIYEERIDEEIRSQADYFQEECVRILAGGDSTALGV